MRQDQLKPCNHNVCRSDVHNVQNKPISKRAPTYMIACIRIQPSTYCTYLHACAHAQHFEYINITPSHFLTDIYRNGNSPSVHVLIACACSHRGTDIYKTSSNLSRLIIHSTSGTKIMCWQTLSLSWILIHWSLNCSLLQSLNKTRHIPSCIGGPPVVAPQECWAYFTLHHTMAIYSEQ